MPQPAHQSSFIQLKKRHHWQNNQCLKMFLNGESISYSMARGHGFHGGPSGVSRQRTRVTNNNGVARKIQAINRKAFRKKLREAFGTEATKLEVSKDELRDSLDVIVRVPAGEELHFTINSSGNVSFNTPGAMHAHLSQGFISKIQRVFNTA
jgi:hypothetical protein